MIDEDLRALLATLRAMKGQESVLIGSFLCSADELLQVVKEAVRARLGNGDEEWPAV